MNNFYEINNQQYFDSTVKIDSSSFLAPFTDMLKLNSKVLDIGCGSGRDLLWFKKQGFDPTGFEYSPSLASLARKYSSCPVIEGDFFSYNFSIHTFDALCCIGSLVHVGAARFESVLKSICNALCLEGILFITLKEGSGLSHADDGRVFVLWSKRDLENIFSRVGLKALNFTRQVSKLRKNETWLGFVLRFDSGS